MEEIDDYNRNCNEYYENLKYTVNYIFIGWAAVGLIAVIALGCWKLSEIVHPYWKSFINTLFL